jgi:hypothetical protein
MNSIVIQIIFGAILAQQLISDRLHSLNFGLISLNRELISAMRF